MKSIVNGKVYFEGEFCSGLAVVYNQGIKEILDEAEYRSYLRENTLEEEINAGGSYILPGFIDIHIHGYQGKDTMDADLEGLKHIAKGIAANGVTAFLPTTMTMSMDRIRAALDTVRMLQNEDVDGAMVLGAHLEGPFINAEKKGAQSADYIHLPDTGLLDQYEDVIKVVTIAPEVFGAKEMIKNYSSKMNFSIGHTSATFDQASEAYDLGASGTTHLFNAMTGLHHREPGVVGAALACDCYTEIIADNIHLNTGLYGFLLKTKGIARLLLITDCMQAGGLKDGQYELGGQPVTMAKGKCVLTDHPETIAGSVLKLNRGLQNFTEASQRSLKELIPLVTANQAAYLGLDQEMGTLEVGKLANIVVMDQNFNIMTTIVKGKRIYENQV